MTGHPKSLLANATAALLDRGHCHAIPHIHPNPLPSLALLVEHGTGRAYLHKRERFHATLVTLPTILRISRCINPPSPPMP